MYINISKLMGSFETINFSTHLLLTIVYDLHHIYYVCGVRKKIISIFFMFD